MNVHTSYSQVKSLIDQLKPDTLLSVTAPLYVNDSIIICIYSDILSVACVHVPMSEFEPVRALLYKPKHFQLAVHGLKRIWEQFGIGDYEIQADRVWDVKLMAYLLNPGLDKEHGYALSHLTEEYLGERYSQSSPDLCDRGYPDSFYWLLGQDARRIHDLAQALPSMMSTGLIRLYQETEVPLMGILARMHRDGVGVDGHACAQEIVNIQDRMDNLIHAAQAETNKDVDWHTDKGVYRFWGDLGRRVEDQAEDVEFILKELHDIPFAKEILEWRDLSSDASFLEKAAGRDRVHPVWRQTRGATGRIFSAVVPVQSIDKKKYRPLLVPAPGHVLLKPDYSAFQLRLLAHLSGDPLLIEVFMKNEDIHAKTADWLGLPGSSEQRRNQAKAINFGICFGQGADSLASDLGLYPDQAQSYIDGFFAIYRGAGDFFEKTVQSLKDQKIPDKRVISSPFGRVRRFTTRFTSKEARKARVTLLQQMESDIVKQAMGGINREFAKRAMRSKIVVMIHDSIWVEAPDDEAKEATQIMEKVMTTAADLKIPLQVKFE
jgi:DNA polymerase I